MPITRTRLLTLGASGLALVAAGVAQVLRRSRSADVSAPSIGGWPLVVIVGGGFGGLRAALSLARAPATWPAPSGCRPPAPAG